MDAPPLDRIDDARRWVLLAAVSAVPLVFLTSAVNPFQLPKATAACIAVVALVLLGALRVVASGQLRIPTGPVAISVASFAVAVVVTTAFSDDRTRSIVGAYGRYAGALTYLGLAVVFVTIVQVFEPRTISSLARAVLAGIGLAAAYGLVQMVGWDPVEYTGLLADEVVASLGNPNQVAAVMAIGIPIALAQAGTRSGRPSQLAYLAVAALLVLVMVGSGSLQGPFAAAVGVGLVLLVHAVRLTGSRRKAAIAVWCAAATTGGGLMALGLLERGPLGLIGEQRTFVSRTYIWEAAASAFTDAPIVGLGLGRFETAYRQHRSVEAAIERPLDELADVVHNVPLKMFAEGGVVLGVTYLAFVVLVAVALVRALRRSRRPGCTGLTALRVGVSDAGIDTAAGEVARWNHITPRRCPAGRHPTPMSTHTPRIRRMAAALAAVGALALVGPLVTAGPAQAVQETTTSRIAGADRFATAADIATTEFPDGATDVVLATGLDFADALAASGLAGALDAPLLLTLPGSLPSATSDAITELGPDNIFLIGGEAAISASVQSTLESADYTVTRYAGTDRFGTAAAVGEAIDATDDSLPLTTDDGVGETADGRTAIVAFGLDFPDAVSASQLAFAGRFPILLTTTDTVPQATLDALESLGIEHVLVVGGGGVISQAAVDAIEDTGATTARLSGANRFGTSVAVADFAKTALDFGGPTVYLATGLDFADALGGGVISGRNAAPLVLVATDALPAEIATYLAANGSAFDDLVALGGNGAISAATLADAADAAQLDSNQVYAVDPGDSKALDQSDNAFGNAGQRSFTVTELEPDTDFVIALLDAEVVNTAGDVTISEWSLSDEATTSIESVNGSPVNAAGSGGESVQETGTSSGSGELSFAIDATSPDSVVPVVFLDEDGDGELTRSGASPMEPFGVGGRTSWLPTQAGAGSYDLTVTSVNRAENYFIARVGAPPSARAFFYDSGDTLTLGGLSLTLSKFEGMLSARDELTVTYATDSTSSFRVDVDDIPDIANQKATVVGDQQVTVSWDASEQPDVVYTITRIDPAATLVTDTTATSLTIAETNSPARYRIVPKGATSDTVDDTDDAGDPVEYVTNGVRPAVPFRLHVEGVTVEQNAGAAGVTTGDVWLLHFSRSIDLAGNPTITVDPDGITPATTVVVNSSNAQFNADGSTLRVVFTSNALGTVEYGTSAVTALSGVTNSGQSPTVEAEVIDDDGPELLETSSSCVAGDSVCTIAFNEVVTASSAENPTNYTAMSGPGNSPNFVTGATLADDGRTVTFTFDHGLDAGTTLAPTGAVPGSAVADAENGDTSDQDAFVITG